jgi:hypothetical protein
MRRPALLGAAWLTAAAAAVGLGFLAVSFVGASAASSASSLAATGSVTRSAGEGGTGTSSAAPPVATAQQVTPGGTVIAHCTGGVAALAGAPRAGWWADDSSGPGAVEFTNGALKVEVRATCPSGSPSFAVEGPAATGKGGASSSSASFSSSSPAGVAPSPTTDDKGGLRSGGNGGSGRGGGGHGSDG